MSDPFGHALGWEDISRHRGLEDIEAQMARSVIPQLEALPREALSGDGSPRGIEWTMAAAFGLFAVSFFATFWLLPETGWGIALRFILFPILFIASLALVAFLRWGAIKAFLLRSARRMRARATALDEIAALLGVDYVTTPGSQSPLETWLLRQSWVDPELKDAAADLGGDGSMGEAVTIAREAGLMGPEAIVIGSAEQKAQFAAHEARGMRVEDGFCGTRDGVGFNVFEWVESVSDDPDIYHLVITLAAPIRLQGRHEVRSRRIGWLAGKGDEMDRVDLGARAFSDKYRLRSTDQVEARAVFDPAVMERLIAVAHGDAFRGVAYDSHLVFDIAGEDRFVLINKATGAWNDESLRAAITDLVQTLALVDALAASFRVPRA